MVKKSAARAEEARRRRGRVRLMTAVDGGGGGEGDPGQITPWVSSGYIYTSDWSTCAPPSGENGQLGDHISLGRVDQPPHLPTSKCGIPPYVRKAPSQWDTSLFITAPTLFQLNAARDGIKSGKSKKAALRKQILTPSTNRRMQQLESKGSKWGATRRNGTVERR